MIEEEKLVEAEYFYQRMIAEQNDLLYFRHNLSAFLSASRSVLQYAREEVDPVKNPNAKLGAQAWYQKAVEESPAIKFCRDERNDNIHYSPVNPAVDTALRVSNCTIGDTLPSPAPALTRPLHIYKFKDWSGVEDVPTLCRKYLDGPAQFTKEGVSLGHISG